MSAFTRHSRAFPRLRRQRGVALVVALVLLLVATIVGLAASRGALLQERMSANSFDRSLAFQRAESALRGAESAIAANWDITSLGGTDCSAAACGLVPSNSFSGTDATWQNAASVYDVNDANTPGVPQYNVQLMGTGSSDDDNGTQQNADAGNYGASTSPPNVAFYRVTGRSSDPTSINGRAVVVLQTTVKRPF